MATQGSLLLTQVLTVLRWGGSWGVLQDEARGVEKSQITQGHGCCVENLVLIQMQ